MEFFVFFQKFSSFIYMVTLKWIHNLLTTCVWSWKTANNIQYNKHTTTNNRKKNLKKREKSAFNCCSFFCEEEEEDLSACIILFFTQKCRLMGFLRHHRRLHFHPPHQFLVVFVQETIDVLPCSQLNIDKEKKEKRSVFLFTKV